MSYLWSIMELESGICLERFLPARTIRQNPMLFVHGNFSGSWCWHNFLKYFASRGVSCYAVNLRGHWLSKGHADLGRTVTEHYIEDVEACLQAIGANVILVGHSMGGIVCQKVAEKNKIAKLILVDSAPCRKITETYLGVNPAVLEMLNDLFIHQPDGTAAILPDKEKIRSLLFEKNKVSEETLAQTITFLGRESGQVLKNHASLAVDPKRVRCPVYVLGRTGLGNDRNPDLWQALAEYYDAADRCIRSDISHCMILENDWQVHAGLIERWSFG